MVSFLHYWAIGQFLEMAAVAGRNKEVKNYTELEKHVKEVCNRVLWDGEWFIWGITKDGRKIGTQADKEGRIHLESNAWAVAADNEKGFRAMDAVDQYLFTPYGIMLNRSSYTKPEDAIGFVTKVFHD